MSTIEAMKLALGALENAEYGDYDKKELNEAITALQKALAQERNSDEQPAQQSAERVEPVAWRYRDAANDDGTWSAWLGCDKRLVEDEYRQVRALFTSPQPAHVQQEPAAVVSGYYGGQCVILPIDPARIYNSNTFLYTSPQPAQQEPLTDVEIAKEVEAELTHYWNGEYIDTTGARDHLTAFARAIEAAHGIKENT